MSGLRHGGVVVDLPDDWADRSTLLFVGPTPPSPTLQKQRVAQPSVSMTFVRASKSAREILEDELEGLRAMSLGFALASVEPFTCAFGDGVISRHRLELDGVSLVQLHAVAVRQTVAVRAVASAGELDFARLEPVLRSVLASLRTA